MQRLHSSGRQKDCSYSELDDNEPGQGWFFSRAAFGRVLHKGMQEGSASGVSLTAYALISLLENAGNPHVSSSSYVAARTSAVQFLESPLSTYVNAFEVWWDP